MWTQFTADARASYGFYMTDAVAGKRWRIRRGRRSILSNCQAIVLVAGDEADAGATRASDIAFVLLVFSGFHFEFSNDVKGDFNFTFITVMLLLLLLALELADKVTMKRDLEIAREIQMWLVPSSPPQVAGADIAFASRPQNSVAGDYYDAFYPTASAAENGKLMLVIADVAGKSIPAALLMATLQASLRTIAGEGASLGDLVVRLNRYASAHSLDGRRFTTAVFGEYDPATRHLAYVNAGHNPPILRRANGATEKLEAGGLPLGIDAGAVYDSGALDLKPGDALIFYTDGVIEAFDESGKEFGEPRWIEAIRALPDWNATESLQFLMKRVDEFVGATRQSDDITCLVFRCK